MTVPALLLSAGGIEQVLDLARRHLDMDLALLSEFTDGQSVARRMAGDAGSFGAELDNGVPLEHSYCRAMVAGEIPHAVEDAAVHPVLRNLPPTAAANIRAYVGVPVCLSDGSVYGSLCTLSHDPQRVDERDAKFLGMLAELVAREVEGERDRDAARARITALILDESLVEIALQPIVDIRTGRSIGVEALSRFPARYGSPDLVFAAAHAAQVGMELENVAASRAFSLLPLLGPDQYLAVNMSPEVAIQLGTARPDLPYHRLVLEITEHALIENYALLRDSLAWARRQGLRISIDDAGAGYASLHHIVELAPNIIKIDRSLIDGISDSRALRSVAGAFVALASDLHAGVVAEGVERLEDLQTVRDLAITSAQGYLLARPTTDRTHIAHWRNHGLMPPLTGIADVTS